MAGAWSGYLASEELAQLFHLPHWFPELTLILLILGVPMTVTTAYVQRGFGSDDEIRAEHGLATVFNWRNALLGGAVAVLLLVIVAAGWVVLAEHLVDEFHQTPG